MNGNMLIGIIACIFAADQCFAAKAQANISVTASITQKCKISTTDVDFGIYDPVIVNLASALNAAVPGTLSVSCSKITSGLTLELSMGVNSAGGSARRMRDMGRDSQYLNYQLFQPSSATPGAACAYAAIWGDGSNGTAFVPTGARWGTGLSQSFNVCGQIAPNQQVMPGVYADVVIATVKF